MHHRLFLPIVLAIVLFTGMGCQKNETAKAPTRDTKIQAPVGKYPVTIAITKSAQNKNVVVAHVTTEMISLKDALHAAQLNLEIVKLGQQEMISKLDGVITTAANGWHLYINQQPRPFITLDDVIISAHDTIEWRYEAVRA